MGLQCFPAASQAPHEPTRIDSRRPVVPPATPSSCAQGERARGTDVLSPSSSLSFMDPEELQLSQLLESASAPGDRTTPLPLPPGLYPGAPALPALCCSEQFSKPPPASGGWSSKIAGPLPLTASGAAWQMPGAHSHPLPLFPGASLSLCPQLKLLRGAGEGMLP